MLPQQENKYFSLRNFMFFVNKYKGSWAGRLFQVTDLAFNFSPKGQRRRDNHEKNAFWRGDWGLCAEARAFTSIGRGT